jgi:hypothetical protein
VERKPETKLNLERAPKRVPPVERRIFLATEEFCQLWGDRYQLGDVIESVSDVIEIKARTVLRFGWRRVVGPTGRA